MTPLIKKAQKGNKEAFVALYNANKEKVLYLCNWLLCDQMAAENACMHVFKSTWEFVLDEKIESEREFKDFVINKAVNHCKNKISKSDSKAFKIPQNKNFIITSFDINSSSDDIFQLALETLPAIHRFIYVLDMYLIWESDEIAEVLHTKADTVKLALDCRKNNFERLSSAIKQERNINTFFTEEDFSDYLSDSEGEPAVDEALDLAVISNIEAIIEPIIKAKKKKKKKICLIAGISLVVAILIAAGIVALCLVKNNENQENLEETDEYEDYEDEYYDLDWKTTVESPTEYAIIDIANYGKITVALDANSAPETVANFVNLAKNGFYDGLTFHRIIEGFMMQGGDPNGDGTGGYTDASGNEMNIVGEFYYNGYDNLLSHVRGAISMARSESYDSASSQFFIVQEDCSLDLDGDYAAFGYVIEGMDVVDKVCEKAEPTDDNGTIEKADQPVITSIKIYTPDEYAALDKTEETVTVIEAKIAEVSAISARDKSLFLTVYGLTEDASDYQITDAAKVELSKYATTDKLEKYVVDSKAKVYKIKDGAMVEFSADNIVEGDMLVIYTNAEEIVNVVVYHIENTENNESNENQDAENSEEDTNTETGDTTETTETNETTNEADEVE